MYTLCIGWQGRNFLGQGAEIFTREIWVRPTYACEIYPDSLRFAGAIREKPIMSKYATYFAVMRM